MVEQEIEYTGAEENYWRNPLEVRRETPVSRHDKPHIENTKNPASYSHEITQVGVQPILEKWADKSNNGESNYAESD